MSALRANASALVLAGVLLCGLATGQDGAAALEASRAAAGDAWVQAREAEQEARRRASAARGELQALVLREQRLASPPWFLPGLIVEALRGRVREAQHAASLAVVTAEHELADASASEQIAKLRLIDAADAWTSYLQRSEGDAAAIDSEQHLLAYLGSRLDVAPPAEVPPPPRDPGSLARLTDAQLAGLILTFEEVAAGADRRSVVLARLEAQARAHVATLARRVEEQGVVALATPLAIQRRQQERLCGWLVDERDRALRYRGYTRELEAEEEAREARRRSKAPEGDG